MDTLPKKVLFISVDFYEYIDLIIEKIKLLGYDVTYFCQDPHLNLIERYINRFNKNYIIKKSKRIQRVFLKNSKHQYDYVFVIKGDKLDFSFLTELKHTNLRAELVLYLWDDVARISNFNKNKSLYDKIYTFDRKDAAIYNLIFLPLFFCDQYNISYQEKSLDVFFSGWDHSNRQEIINKVIKKLVENNMSYYFHLYTSRLRFFQQLIKEWDFTNTPNYIKFTKLNLFKNAEFTLKSKIVLDIQHNTQNGLTMRTIECLASKTKLITTNHNVKEYDFYLPQNILVIDRYNPVLDVEFMKTPYISIHEDIVQKYSLDHWIKTIFS